MSGCANSQNVALTLGDGDGLRAHPAGRHCGRFQNTPGLAQRFGASKLLRFSSRTASRKSHPRILEVVAGSNRLHFVRKRRRRRCFTQRVSRPKCVQCPGKYIARCLQDRSCAGNRFFHTPDQTNLLEVRNNCATPCRSATTPSPASSGFPSYHETDGWSGPCPPEKQGSLLNDIRR